MGRLWIASASIVCLCLSGAAAQATIVPVEITQTWTAVAPSPPPVVVSVSKVFPGGFEVNGSLPLHFTVGVVTSPSPSNTRAFPFTLPRRIGGGFLGYKIFEHFAGATVFATTMSHITSIAGGVTVMIVGCGVNVTCTSMNTTATLGTSFLPFTSVSPTTLPTVTPPPTSLRIKLWSLPITIIVDLGNGPEPVQITKHLEIHVIPEPNIAVLLGCGVAGLLLLGRSRTRR